MNDSVTSAQIKVGQLLIRLGDCYNYTSLITSRSSLGLVCVGFPELPYESP